MTKSPSMWDSYMEHMSNHMLVAEQEAELEKELKNKTKKVKK
jgi:hypothetical protein